MEQAPLGQIVAILSVRFRSRQSGVLGERCAAALSAFFQGKRALGKK
jgi:hypothetical protein